MTQHLPQHNHPSDPSGDFLDAARLYSETAKVASVFWDWRHKVMTRFFTFSGAVLLACGWFYQHEELRPFVGIPMALGAVNGLISYLLDMRNMRILKSCYRIAGELEIAPCRGGGIFHAIASDYDKLAFHPVLRCLYLGTTIFFVVAGTAASILYFVGRA